jgi:hypothetical protein
LRRVATASRARFEAALEHVALHEGLLLPESAAARAPRLDTVINAATPGRPT